MPTRNVDPTDTQERLIEALVQSGRYRNASDVLKEGLRLVESREREEVHKLDALRAAIDAGLDALDRGEGREFPSSVELIDYLKSLGAKTRASFSERK